MFRNNQYYLPVVLMLILVSCIKRYDPDIDSTDKVKYVITGSVNKGDSIQRVNISTTSLLSRPRIIPVTGCSVKIIDGKGNIYIAKDVWKGNYEANISESELVAGNTFMVDIQVPGGAHIVSDFDHIQDCPEVDSVFYMREDIPGSNPYFPTRGIRFYLNLDADTFSCRNYKLEAIETWEYTAPFPDYADRRVCWVSSNIRSIFDFTTKNQTANIYTLYPLNFVDNYSSQRLRYMYSLLINQYSLSEAAFAFWEKMRINSSDQGGLYENQPFQVSGNLHNLTNPDQQVLGFFGASAKKSKRIFVSEVPGLPNQYVDCRPAYWPEIAAPECLDCTALVGGTNVKPKYWPN